MLAFPVLGLVFSAAAPVLSQQILPATLTSFTAPAWYVTDANIEIATAPMAACIVAFCKSGASRVQGLVPKTANTRDNANLEWRVGTRTTPGKWPITTSWVPLSSSTPPISSPSPTVSPSPLPPVSSPPPPSGSRIAWLGKEWFLFGANLPWRGYGVDFSGTSKGVSNPTNYDVIEARLQQAAATGMHTIRWWVLAQNYVVMKDRLGAPIGINTGVYTDFDAALRLARKYDLYYVFDLFRDPGDIKNWVNDSAQREQLAQVLGPFFAHYSGNAHILSWEIFNEPEYSIWDNSVSNSAAQDTIRQVTASIHAHSTAYASTGSADLDWAGNWTGLGLDFVTPHGYLHVGNYSPWTMTASQIQSLTHSNYPLGIGEFVANSITEGAPDALTRWDDIYNGGYIGGWSWSLWPEATEDRLYVDFSAAKTFSQMHSDLGPHQ